MDLPSPEHVKSRLSYDPNSGELTWKTNRQKNRIGKKTGAISQGYLNILVLGRLHRAHRLAWCIMTGAWPEHEIDHINLDRSDNRWDNLRPADKRQNAQNTRLRSNNTSGFKGVSWDRDRRKWRADIKLAKRRKHLGLFSEPTQAHAAYARAAGHYFGLYGRVS